HQPHTSTLFPYTTLFRSPRANVLFDDGTEAALLAESLDQVLQIAMFVAALAEFLRRQRFGLSPLWFTRRRHVANFRFRGLDGLQDRKSTRLNSSHLVISY